MAFSKMCALPVLALCAVLVGCNDNKKNGTVALVDDNESLTKQLDNQNTRLNELGLQMQRERDRADDLAAQLAQCQEGAVGAPPPGTVTSNAADFKGIPGVDVCMVGNDIHLTIASSLLFDSGKTALKESSKKSLDQVATKIKENYPGREILVVGHTDSDPIRKSAFATNYHLGFERAFRVREYMGKKGVTDQQMALMSYGPDQPQGSKDKSRRVEIVVTATEIGSGTKVDSPRNASTAAGKAAATKKTATSKNAAPAKSAAPVKAAASTKTATPTKKTAQPSK